MGRSVLILAGAAAVLTSISLFGGAGTSAQRSVEHVADHAERMLAREIALTGHGRTLTVLTEALEDGDPYTGPPRYEGAYQGGTYASNVTTSADTVTVVTRGRYGAAAYVIRARYERGNGALSTEGGEIPVPPPFMDAALLVDGNMTIKRRFTVTSSVPGVNANIRSNRTITFSENYAPSMVQGFGLYSDRVNTTTQPASDIFQPVYNPNNDPSSKLVPVVEVPPINVQDFRDTATQFTPGALSLSGDVQLGTREEPVIWYVAGALNLDGVNFLGYGIFLAERTISFRGEVTSDVQGHETGVAYMTNMNVSQQSGVMSMAGHIMARGNISFSSSATLYGGMTTQSNFELVGGELNIVYKPVSNAITEPLFPGQSSTMGGDNFVLRLFDFREGG